MRGLEPGSEEYASNGGRDHGYLDAFDGACEPGRGRGVSLAEWLATLEDTAADDEKYAMYVTPFAGGVIALLDLDDDGIVGLVEYQEVSSRSSGSRRRARRRRSRTWTYGVTGA